MDMRERRKGRRGRDAWVIWVEEKASCMSQNAACHVTAVDHPTSFSSRKEPYRAEDLSGQILLFKWSLLVARLPPVQCLQGIRVSITCQQLEYANRTKKCKKLIQSEGCMQTWRVP